RSGRDEARPLGPRSSVKWPQIFNLAVSTIRSLHDGSSVIIGGLMSRRSTASDGGVPYLKEIPLLGNLFKSQNKRENKTELIVMIVPYIVETDAQATSLTRSISEQYQLLEVPEAGPGETGPQNPQ